MADNRLPYKHLCVPRVFTYLVFTRCTEASRITHLNEGGMDMKHIIRVLYLLVFIASMALIITGQRHIGPAGLLTMLAGLAGILVLLYLYNKKYQ